MWTPTHVQVTVQAARNLLIKGKNGMNDAFVTIALGKERFQTSVKEHVKDSVKWHEECELSIPTKQGNKSEIVLTALSQNFIGDDFLGMVRIPLAELDFNKSPSVSWYVLKNKPGKENVKDRGELEVKIAFVVKTGLNVGSLSDLSKKESHKSSFGQFVGGSLLSLGKEKKGLKNFAKAVGNKVSTLPGRGKKKNKNDEGFGSIPEKSTPSRGKQNKNEADPGVISDEEDDDFRFDELSHKSSGSSLAVSNVALSTPQGGSLENLGGGEFLRKNFNTPPPPPISTNSNLSKKTDEWDTKLFAREATFVKDYPTVNSDDIPTPKIKTEPVTPTRFENQTTPTKSKAIPPNVDQNVFKEPIPRPRQVTEIISREKQNKIGNSTEDLSNINYSSSSSDRGKIKEKTKSTTKETFASLFSSPNKNKGSDESLNHSKQGGTPIGVSSPIRQKESSNETRLPRETVKKFEGKSRDDLIERVLSLEDTVDSQKQKIKDMESYLENLLVRVMESKPTLLQSPFVTVHSYKSKGLNF